MDALKTLFQAYAVLAFGFLFFSCAIELTREWRRNPDRRAPLIINAVLSGGAVLAMSFALAESIVDLLPAKPVDRADFERALDELFPASGPSR